MPCSSNKHHRSFHFCRRVLSTHSFFLNIRLNAKIDLSNPGWLLFFSSGASGMIDVREWAGSLVSDTLPGKNRPSLGLIVFNWSVGMQKDSASVRIIIQKRKIVTPIYMQERLTKRAAPLSDARAVCWSTTAISSVPCGFIISNNLGRFLYVSCCFGVS